MDALTWINQGRPQWAIVDPANITERERSFPAFAGRSAIQQLTRYGGTCALMRVKRYRCRVDPMVWRAILATGLG